MVTVFHGATLTHWPTQEHRPKDGLYHGDVLGKRLMVALLNRLASAVSCLLPLLLALLMQHPAPRGHQVRHAIHHRVSHTQLIIYQQLLLHIIPAAGSRQSSTPVLCCPSQQWFASDACAQLQQCSTGSTSATVSHYPACMLLKAISL